MKRPPPNIDGQGRPIEPAPRREILMLPPQARYCTNRVCEEIRAAYRKSPAYARLHGPTVRTQPPAQAPASPPVDELVARLECGADCGTPDYCIEHGCVRPAATGAPF